MGTSERKSRRIRAVDPVISRAIADAVHAARTWPVGLDFERVAEAVRAGEEHAREMAPVVEAMERQAATFWRGLPNFSSMIKAAWRYHEARAPELRRFAEWIAQSAAEYQRQFDLALAGDNKALIWLFEDSGIAMLEDEPIRKRIDDLRYAARPDRNLLDRLARTIRRSLVPRRKGGRRPTTSRELVSLIAAIQTAYQAVRRRLKPSYRNSSTRLLDIRDVSAHVGASVPERSRMIVVAAARDVLGRSKQWPGKGFGIEVVAKACSRTSRQIRSIRSKQRFRK